MIKVALRGLLGRKLRTVLTAFAIVLGVAMMSGTFVLTDTIDAAFKGIFQESYANTDAIVVGKGADISFQGTQAETPPFSEDVLEQIRALPGVAAATGTVSDLTNTKILTKEGKAVNTEGAPSFGLGIDPTEAEFNPLRLLEGAWPTGANEVVLDVATADKLGYKIGDTVDIATIQPTEEFRITGLAQYGEVKSLGSATFAVFTVPEAQRLLDREGQFDEISVAAAEGTTPEALVAELKQELPSDQVSVRSAAEQTDEDLESVEFTKFIRYFLLSFAGIALFVGAFVIFNTLSITVAQRTREFATLRTIGASRRQLLTSVIIESFVIGLLASIVGLFLGFGLAIGLKELIDSSGGGLPTTSYVFAPRTFIVAILVGVIVTLLAGLFPAIRATRVPPIAAVREGAELPRGRFARFSPFVAGVFLLLSLFLLGQALFKDDLDTAPRLLSIVGGVLLLFIARRDAVAVDDQAARRGGRLAGDADRRRRGQAGPRQLDSQHPANGVDGCGAHDRRGPRHLRRGARQRVQGLEPRRDRVAGERRLRHHGAGRLHAVRRRRRGRARRLRRGPGGLGGALGSRQGLELGSVRHRDRPRGDQRVLQLRLGRGLRRLGAREPRLDRRHRGEGLRRGQQPQGRQSGHGPVRRQQEGVPRRCRASTSRRPSSPSSVRCRSTRRRSTRSTSGRATSSCSRTRTGTLPRRRPRRSTTAVADFPDAKVQSREEWITQQDEEFNSFLMFIYVLLALAVVVSLFGMVNTLVLTVFERTREIGMLRAVGMTRRQTRRMIRHESVITALIGAALGLPLGVFLAVLVTKALSQFDVKVAVPWGQLIFFAIVAIIVGILAAIAPARRAAKLNVLRALQYE